MFKKFKVPVGVNDHEKEMMEKYFEENKTLWERIFGSKKKSVLEAADGVLNQHSKVIYLIAPDNKFINMYKLDISEEELLTQLIEDISYDIGQNYIGSKYRPDLVDEEEDQLQEQKQ